MPDALLEHADLPAFVAACQAVSVTSIALCWRKEWGPPQLATAAGEYGPRDEIRLLAYHQGTIHACDLEGVPRDQLDAELTAAGFTVEQRSRNLATFDRD